MTTLAPVLQAFFTDRLIAQRGASSHTISGYRDTFRLLVRFASAKTGKTPSALDIADLDAGLIVAFLEHLERDRHNTVRTRNWRLAAVHSLFGYAALHHPEHAADIQRVLAVPAKRHERRPVSWLTDAEVDALLAAPDRTTWTGRRDHAMLLLAVQTGLRISELIGLSRADIALGRGAHVRCMGKGRKERATLIALWLGHEQINTANIYLHADMDQKERAIARVTPAGTAPGRYQPPDPLLAFLDRL